MEMSVFRVHKNENYTVLSNYHFKEKGMSLKAKGLLSLMLSLPENWDYSAAGLVTLSKDGKDSVNAALKELEKFGYLRRTQAYDESGKFRGYDYEIFEKPSAAVIADNSKERKRGKPTTENPFAENPSTGKPTTENPQQLNTKKSNTKKSNTYKLKEEEGKKKTPAGSYDDIIKNRIFNEDLKETIYEFIKMRQFIKKPLTNYALTRLINKLKKLSDDPKEQIEILEESILKTRPDIYPLKKEKPAEAAPSVDGETDPDDVLKYIKGNVLLSENQIGHLLDKMGLEAFDYYLERLSSYINENGNVINHYGTLLRWHSQDSAVAR